MEILIVEGPVPVRVVQIPTAGLGDHSYLVAVGDQGVVVDPQRDHGRFEDALEAASARLVGVLETHIHNDYVSGGRRLASRHDADYVLPAGTGAVLPHLALGDGDVIELGEWRLDVVGTPGHTPHHVAYVLTGPQGPVAALTGGSMLVGAVGRSDLVAPELTAGLIGDQHRSVRRLASVLPGTTVVAPTHGAGSFCSTTPAGDTTSTIDAERRDNPALRTDDVDRFVAEQLSSATAYPTYYRYMAPINLRGGDPMPTATVPEVPPGGLDGFDGEVIDLRPLAVSAAGRIPGSIPIPMADDVAGYAAWIVPWGTPLVLVGAPGEVAAVVTQLARIGHDRVVGAVTDGLEAWVADSRPLDAHEVVAAEDLLRRGPEHVLDVRDPVEFRGGAVPGAWNIHVASLPLHLDELPSGEIWVYCASGYRAAMAAGLLARSGRRPVLVTGDPSAAAVTAPG